MTSTPSENGSAPGDAPGVAAAPGDAPGDAPAIELRAVTKRFGEVVAVDAVDLTIRQGEFFALLGPSGCGKTTTLRMLAGFEFPDAGTILLEGRDVSSVAANKRPVNMVFQRYELFPHMTVAENVGYGLRMRKVPKAEARERVSAMLDVVGVAGLEKRRADQLSGGQQQRVALARALVNRPRVLLLDEPLSALDVKLRKHMQLELKSIQHELGTTFVYVTHDQEEALLMSDRIGVMAAGELLQVASPRELYERPTHAFVADFVGTLNELSLTVDALDDAGRAVANVGDGGVVPLPADATLDVGTVVRAGIRPERVVLVGMGDPPAEGSRLPGTVADVVYLGPLLQYVVDTAAGQLVVQVPSAGEDTQLTPGQPVVATWPTETLLVLGTTASAESGEPARSGEPGEATAAPAPGTARAGEAEADTDTDAGDDEAGPETGGAGPGQAVTARGGDDG
jgi:spermidine/putrescine transport system ATP-binding protein